MSLKAFLSENVKKVKEVEFVVSDRFLDDKGKPVPFVLAPISAAKDSAIREECSKSGVDNNGKAYFNFDSSKYMNKVVVSTVKYPDFHNKELQDSYGVMGAEKLLTEMLISGEFNRLVEKVKEVNGMRTYQEEEDEAKNE